MSFAQPVSANVSAVGKGPDGKKRHVVRIVMVLNPGSPPQEMVQLGQVQVNGDSYSFNALSLGPVEIGSIKAIAYNVTFVTGQGGLDQNDGDFLIYIPATGQLIDIASGNLQNNTNTIFGNAVGCLSVVTSNNPTIVFMKAANAATQMAGIVVLTLFDFEVAPWALPTQVSFGL